MPEKKSCQFRESQVDQRQARHRVVCCPVFFGMGWNHRAPFCFKRFASADIPRVGRPIQQHTIKDAAKVSFRFGRYLKEGFVHRIVGLHVLDEW